MEKCIICGSPHVYSSGYCKSHYFSEHKRINSQRFLVATLNRLNYSPKTKTALLYGGNLIDERLSEI